MASQKQQLESTISSLQERVSDLASRIFSNHSLPLHSSTLSPSEGHPPGSPEYGSDDDDLAVERERYEAGRRDADDDLYASEGTISNSDDDHDGHDYDINDNDYDEDWKLDEFREKA